jgi:hypothetical protein
MAKSVIIDKKSGYTGYVKSTDFGVAKVAGESHSAKATSIDINTKVSLYDYPITKVTDGKHEAKIVSILPFRVKFTSVGIPGYGPHNPAPIGIAIIGYSNYIL